MNRKFDLMINKDINIENLIEQYVMFDKSVIGKLISVDENICEIEIDKSAELDENIHYIVVADGTDTDISISLEEIENGDIFDGSDIRDYKYAAIAGTTSIVNDFPESYQVKYMGNEVKNQGTVGCCAACTLATINEAWQQKLYDNDIKFSEGWNYGALRGYRTSSTGMISADAIKRSTSVGMVSKDKFDLMSEMPNAYDEVHMMEELFKYASQYKVSSYYAVNNGNRKTGGQKDLEIKHALMTYDVPLYSISPKKFGSSHAICIVGWDDTEDKYIVKNSWGSTYGSNGDGTAKINKSEFDDVYVLLCEDPILPFTDVDSNAWYAEDVKKSYLQGTMKGISETEFDPNGYVTRAQLATVLNRMTDLIAENDRLNKTLIEYKIKKNKYKN